MALDEPSPAMEASAPPPAGADAASVGGQPKITTRVVDILRNRDFRLLWSGQFVSLLGDQFFLVALPWLVLQLTGTAFSVGAVVAVNAAPRAVFILLGGVLIDRWSPRTVMLYSNITRMVLVTVLAVLTATGVVRLWMLYPFAFLLGLGYALFLPALSAVIPRLVPEDRLQAGNAIIQGTSQLSLFIGPVLAGVMITLLGAKGAGAAAVPQASGLGLVFGLDAVGFLVSAITLALLALPPWRHDDDQGAARSGVFQSLGEGLALVWRDTTLRHYFVLIGAVNLALLGPLAVGLPVLAHSRFSGGALAYGGILSGLGLGALVGLAAGGAFRRPQGRAFAAALLASCAALGIGLALVGALPSAGLAAVATFVIGVAEGYLIVQFITWLQIRTSPRELGRMMSILLFVSVGMAPLSNLVAGVLIAVNVTALMVGAGCLIVLVAVVAALSPSVWRISETGRRSN